MRAPIRNESITFCFSQYSLIKLWWQLVWCQQMLIGPPTQSSMFFVWQIYYGFTILEKQVLESPKSFDVEKRWSKTNFQKGTDCFQTLKAQWHQQVIQVLKFLEKLQKSWWRLICILLRRKQALKSWSKGEVNERVFLSILQQSRIELLSSDLMKFKFPKSFHLIFEILWLLKKKKNRTQTMIDQTT